jgi:hypothetical protein
MAERCKRGNESWVELRDGVGKLQGKWDPVTGVLEIQRRGVKTRYWLDEHGGTRS